MKSRHHRKPGDWKKPNGRSWFAAKLCFRSSIVGRTSKRRLWEETIVLVRAADEKEARKRSTALAKSKEHSYKNKYGEVVSWHFEGVKEVVPLIVDRITDGSEVYYRFFQSSKAVQNKK